MDKRQNSLIILIKAIALNIIQEYLLNATAYLSYISFYKSSKIKESA